MLESASILLGALAEKTPLHQNDADRMSGFWCFDHFMTLKAVSLQMRMMANNKVDVLLNMHSIHNGFCQGSNLTPSTK
jgi:hypothetical protein